MPEFESITVLPGGTGHVPFEKLTELRFPPSSISSEPYSTELHQPGEALFSIPLRQPGAASPFGRLCVIAISAELVAGENRDTPLGQVSYKTEQTAQKDKPLVEVVTEAPLIFGIGVRVSSFKQYRELCALKTIIHVGSTRYFLDMVDPLDTDEDTRQYLRDYRKVILSSWDSVNERGEKRNFAIPGRLEDLKKVHLGFPN